MTTKTQSIDEIAEKIVSIRKKPLLVLHWHLISYPDINVLEGCIRGSYAFSVVTGYTCVEDSLLDNTRAFLGLDSGVVKPGKKMKFIQRWILDKILYKLDPGDYAHGFIPGKTIYINAKAHINKDLVLGIDIKDFFLILNLLPYTMYLNLPDTPRESHASLLIFALIIGNYLKVHPQVQC